MSERIKVDSPLNVSDLKFRFVNYLRRPVKIRVMLDSQRFYDMKMDGGSTVVPGLSEATVPFMTVARLFSNQRKFQILVDNVNSWDIYDELQINLDGYNYRMTELHIGMVTSRWVSADNDSTAVMPGAIQGRPYVRIHNMTRRMLSLNGGSIKLQPAGILLYMGADHYGVKLGTVFRDDNSLLQNFSYDVPATDIYFGVTSHIEQGKYSGFQPSNYFREQAELDYNYSLELGYQDGPAPGLMNYAKVPLGIPVNLTPKGISSYMAQFEKMDRWGRPRV